MMVPELPAMITRLGGAEYKGLTIALFTLTAGISRPFSGKLTDTVGRVPVMVFGSLVCVVCSLLYPVAGTVAALLALRLLHGFSTGFKPTGTTAFLADLIPADRRGEAVGVLGIAGSLGMAAGPAAGAWLAQQFSLTAMFFASSAAALLSVLVMGQMRETLPTEQRQPFRLGLLRIGPDEIIEPAVFGPALVMLLTVVSYGMVVTLIPDLSDQLRLPNRGTFFTVMTVASLAARFGAGRVSDRLGRVRVLKYSLALLTAGMALIALAHTPAALLTAAVVFGFASGMNSPTIYAWTIDWAYDERRGRALATAYLALEIGIGAGALVAGALGGTDPTRVSLAFWVGTAITALGWAALFLPWRPHAGTAVAPPADIAAELVDELLPPPSARG